MGEKVMTEAFRRLINETNRFLNSLDYAPSDFFEFEDQYWVDHELDFEYGKAGDKNCDSEHCIASDIMELMDRYDSCDAIVVTDEYCLNEKQIRQKLTELLGKYNLINSEVEEK